MRSFRDKRQPYEGDGAPDGASNTVQDSEFMVTCNVSLLPLVFVFPICFLKCRKHGQITAEMCLDLYVCYFSFVQLQEQKRIF